MRRSSQLLALAAVVAALSAPAVALADQAVVDSSILASVELRRDSDGGVYAATTIESRWGLRLTGTADLYVNGNEVKLDPVDTSNLQILNEEVGDGRSPLLVCLLFSGTIHFEGDAIRHVDRDDCTQYIPKVTVPGTGRVLIPGRPAPDDLSLQRVQARSQVLEPRVRADR